MRNRHRRSLVLALAASVFAASIQSAAHAGVISTQQYLSTVDRDAAIARIDAVLAREEVRKRLEQYGVDPVAANERIAALTDRELEQLATDLENLPAGGSLLGVVGIVFIVLLILELVGVIDIFKKI
jgi:Na+-transporting NADH:ubiquinone oxidoreductase subunit NqrC